MFRSLLAALLMLAVLAPGSARALSCVPATAQEHVQNADAIAVAKVVSEPALPASPRPVPHVLEVETVYKGSLGKQLVVHHNPMVGPDIRLEEGKRYLLLLRRHEGTWRTSLCTGTSQLVDDIPAAFRLVLGEGRTPEGAGDPTPATGVHWAVWAAVAVGVAAVAVIIFRKRK